MSYSSQASIIINVPLEKVWDGLTKPDLVKQYFFGTNLVTTWEVGTPIVFGGEWEGKSYEDKGTVLEYVPNETLSYDYYSPMGGLEDIPENYQIIRYTVEETADGIKTTIDQSNSPSEDVANHSTENWNKVLVALKELIEKGE